MKNALTESGEAENPQRCSSLNGPLRAWSKDREIDPSIP